MGVVLGSGLYVPTQSPPEAAATWPTPFNQGLIDHDAYLGHRKLNAKTMLFFADAINGNDSYADNVRGLYSDTPAKTLTKVLADAAAFALKARVIILLAGNALTDIPTMMATPASYQVFTIPSTTLAKNVEIWGMGGDVRVDQACTLILDDGTTADKSLILMGRRAGLRDVVVCNRQPGGSGVAFGSQCLGARAEGVQVWGCGSHGWVFESNSNDTAGANRCIANQNAGYGVEWHDTTTLASPNCVGWIDGDATNNGLGNFHMFKANDIKTSANSGVGNMTSGSPTLTATTGTFLNGDVGKYIEVTGAGASSATLKTYISARTDSTHVTLGDNASTTITGATWTITIVNASQTYNNTATGNGIRIGGTIGSREHALGLNGKLHIEGSHMVHVFRHYAEIAAPAPIDTPWYKGGWNKTVCGATWVASTAYKVGDIVSGTARLGRRLYFQATVAGTSASTEPEWCAGGVVLVTTGSAVVTLKSGPSFTTGIAGMTIRIPGAASTGNDLYGVISTRDSATQVTLTANVTLGSGTTLQQVATWGPAIKVGDTFTDGGVTWKRIMQGRPRARANTTAYSIDQIMYPSTAPATTKTLWRVKLAGTSAGAEPAGLQADVNAGLCVLDGSVLWESIGVMFAFMSRGIQFAQMDNHGASIDGASATGIGRLFDFDGVIGLFWDRTCEYRGGSVLTTTNPMGTLGAFVYDPYLNVSPIINEATMDIAADSEAKVLGHVNSLAGCGSWGKLAVTSPWTDFT